MSWLDSDCQERELCRHCQRDGNCCLGRRDNGQKGIWQGNSNAGEGDDTAALLGEREKPGKSLVPLRLGAAMQGRNGQPLWYITRDSVTSSSYLQGRKLLAKQGNVNCCHVCMFPSVHPKYSCSCRTSVLQLWAHGDHTCYYTRLKNNLQARLMIAFFGNKDCKNNKICF